MDIICPYCGAELEADGVSPGDEVACPSCGVGFVAATVRARPSARPPALRARPARTWGQRLHSCLLWAVALLIVPPMLSCIWYATREPEPGARPSPPTTTRPTRPAAATSRWEVSDAVDPMTDERRRAVACLSDRATIGVGHCTAWLAVHRIDDGRLQVAIIGNGGGLSWFSGERVGATMRIGSDPAEETTWESTRTGNALIYSGDADELVDRLRGAETVLVRTESILQHTVTLRWPLAGMDDALDLLAHDKPHDKPPKTPPEIPTKSPQIPTSRPSSNPATGAQNPLP